MCKAFSCLVTKSGRVYWKAGVDSHDSICELFVDPELVDDKLPPDNTFARVEIIPPRGDYLNTDFGKWKHQIDEKVKPSFLKPKHKKLCLEAFEKWTEEVYTFNVEEVKNPIHPFNITPPEITEEHIELLKRWASVWASVGASVGDSVWAYCGSLFPIKEWKYVDYTNPLFVKGEYPFQSCVDLWKQGLVPSFNGKVWRLHGGAKGEVLYTL